jgi:hypothetical protein
MSDPLSIEAAEVSFTHLVDLVKALAHACEQIAAEPNVGDAKVAAATQAQIAHAQAEQMARDVAAAAPTARKEAIAKWARQLSQVDNAAATAFPTATHDAVRRAVQDELHNAAAHVYVLVRNP